MSILAPTMMIVAIRTMTDLCIPGVEPGIALWAKRALGRLGGLRAGLDGRGLEFVAFVRTYLDAWPIITAYLHPTREVCKLRAGTGLAFGLIMGFPGYILDIRIFFGCINRCGPGILHPHLFEAGRAWVKDLS